MKNLKKSLSFAGAIALIAQAGFLAFTPSIHVAAETANSYSVNYVETVTNEEVAALGTSLIAGKKAAPYTDGEDGARKSMLGNSSNKDNLGDADTRLAGLTDGSVDKINEMMTAWGQPIKPLYLEYDLGISCSVEKFFMVGQNTKDLNTSAYEVYLSNSRDTLYDAENKIYSYDHTKDGVHGGQIVTFDTALMGSFLAVKITKPTLDNLDQAGHHARIYEIGVYGKAAYSTEYVETVTNDEVAALGSSLIAGKKAAPYTDGEDGALRSMLGNSSAKDNMGDPDTRLAGLTDGSVDKVNELTTGWSQPIKPLYLEYDLGASDIIEGFFMVGTANGTLNTSAYEVYLANSRDSLYNDENKIYSYDHTKDGIHGGQIVTFHTELAGSFLAVKIIKPTIDNLDQAGHHARIFEIGVYGKAAYSTEYVETVTNEDVAALGTSLIAGKKAAPYTDGEDGTLRSMLGNSSAKDNMGDPDTRLAGLTDGSVDKVNELTTGWSQPIKPLYLEYDLGTNERICQFFMVGTANNTLNTSAYEVYLSNSRETLYNTENRIYSYDHAKDGIHGGQIVTFNTKLTGSFLAVKITKPTIDNLDQAGHHARIFEIGVYGLPSYTVRFENCRIADKTVQPGDTLDLSAETPVQNNDWFMGYYTDTECTVPFINGSPITADTTLYAGWIPVKQQPQVQAVQVRLVGKEGLRFISQIDEEAVAQLQALDSAAELGTLVALKNKVDGSFDRTNSAIEAGYMKSVEAINRLRAGQDYTADGTVKFTAVVIEIPEAHYTTDIAARTYVTYTDASGIQRSYYSHEDSGEYYATNLAAAAQVTLDQYGETLTDQEKERLNAIIAAK